jgi:ABC-2 type transport system permease protein
VTKTFLIARHEFWRHVLRRGFLFAIIGLPLLLLLIMGGSIWFFASGARDPIGVVDQSGQLLSPADYTPAGERPVPILAFDSETAARQALEAGDIQAYFVVPPEFPEPYQVHLYYLEEPHEAVHPAFGRYLRTGLLQEVEPVVAQRFIDTAVNVTFVSLAEERGRGNPIGFILPYLFSLLFVIAIFTTAGYLLQAVVDEKENRTMEILITTVSPTQLMSGKIIGLVGVGLVQIGLWSAGLIVLFLILRANFPGLAAIEVPLSTVLVAVAWFGPFYLLVATLMAAIGISVTSVSEGQQATGFISLLSMAPLWFVFIFLNSPNSPLAVALSLFPLTAPISMLVRWQMTEVPAWQLLVSWLLLATTAVFSLFLVSRLLHVGMLRYGQPLRWGEAMSALVRRR